MSTRNFYKRLSHEFSAQNFEKHFSAFAAYLRDPDANVVEPETGAFLRKVHEIACESLERSEDNLNAGRDIPYEHDKAFYLYLGTQGIKPDEFAGWIGVFDDLKKVMSMNEDDLQNMTDWFSMVAAAAKQYLDLGIDKASLIGSAPQGKPKENKSFEKEAFLQYLYESFTIDTNDSWWRGLLENVVDYAVQHEAGPTKDNLAYVLSDLIPEIDFAEAAAFCRDDILTDYGKAAKKQFWKEEKDR